MVEVFSTETCPRCELIKQRLAEKNIDFKENGDIKEIVKLGFMTAPVVKIDSGEFLDFGKAISWINSL